MNKVFLLLAALVVALAASAAQAGTVYFDSGSAQVKDGHVERHAHKRKHKHKVWVPAHRSDGRLVKGHYIWR